MKIEKLPEPKESDIQRSIFLWAQMASRDYPGLELLNASMNGAWIPGGDKSLKFRILAALKKLGCLRNGFPDLSLPVARGGHHGLYIELKRIGGKVSKNQQWWLDKLTAQGYFAVPAWGFKQTQAIILGYLRL